MKWIFSSLLLLSLHAAGQQPLSAEAYWKNGLAEAKVGDPKYAELCEIWKKTDGVPKPDLSEHEIEIVRYWITQST